MARHRDEDDQLEVILDMDAPARTEDPVAAPPNPAPTSAPRSARRWPRVAVLAAVAVLGAAVGAVGASTWSGDNGPRSDDALATVSSLPPWVALTTPPTTVPDPPAFATGYAAEGHVGFSGPLALLDRRTTEEGVTVRSLRPPDDECPPGDWCPPPECRSGAGLVVQISTEQMVGTHVGHRRPDVVLGDGYVAGWGLLGQAEGDPLVVVVVRTPPAVRQVEVVDEHRRRDVVAPVDGWSALVLGDLRMVEVESHEGGMPPLQAPVLDDVHVVARGEGGRELERWPVAADAEPWRSLPGRCERPATPLPAAGVQPADPAAAREEVRRAYVQAWDHRSTRPEKLAALHDATGVEEAMDGAAGSWPQATATTEVEIGDIVFISPEQALLHFRLTYEGAPSLGHRIGGAVQVDGRWKVLRSTYCEVLAQASGRCGAGR